MKYTFKKTFNGLIPTSDCKPYNKLEIGQELELEIKGTRNVKFHRLFFALINLAFENQSHYTNPDELRNDLTISAGHYETRTNYITGEEIIYAKSIKFSKMDNNEFKIIYNDVLDQVWKLLGASKEDIIKELEQF